MTGIDFAARAVLLASTAIANIVGTRIYFDTIPALSALPALAVRKISEVPDQEVPGRYTARVQVDCLSNPTPANGARSPAEVEGLASAVAAVLSKARLVSSPTSWTVGSTKYSITIARVQQAPRMIEPVSGYLHVPVDVLVEFTTS